MLASTSSKSRDDWISWICTQPKKLHRVETGSKSIKFYSLATIFIHSYGQSHAEEWKNKQTKDSYEDQRFVYDNLICIIMTSIHVYSGNYWRSGSSVGQYNLSDRPFNLKGVYGFLFHSEFFFSDDTS